MENNEIKELKKEIRNAKFHNAKMDLIENLKIYSSHKTINRYSLIAIGLAITTFIAIPNKYMQHLHTKTEMDSFGNKKSIEYYDFISNEQEEIITYYSNWQKNDNNEYKRKVEVYRLNPIPENQLFELITNLDNINNSEFIKLFGHKISEKFETEKDISIDELNKKEYFKVTLYDYDLNEYIYIKAENIAYFVAKTILSLGIAYVGTHFITGFYNAYKSEKNGGYDIEVIEQDEWEDYIKIVEKEYNSKKIDIIQLVKKLNEIQSEGPKEDVIKEVKNDFSLDVIPSKNYKMNSKKSLFSKKTENNEDKVNQEIVIKPNEKEYTKSVNINEDTTLQIELSGDKKEIIELLKKLRDTECIEEKKLVRMQLLEKQNPKHITNHYGYKK